MSLQNPYYTSSTTHYSEEFTVELRKKIRRRDNLECQNCDKKNIELHVHHINYNKEDFHEFNLITLCAGCHKKTLRHRDAWCRMFTEYMARRFGSEYKRFIKQMQLEMKKPWLRNKRATS